ncbi:MAG: lysine--tRNA ligase [Candidatus Omnitrophota bacterium]|jgi:lysyl-tRNA synthetase class 2
MDINELIGQREEKLGLLRKEGFSGYDKAPEDEWRVSVSAALSSPEGGKVSLCGRITAKRSHGKVSFMDLKDATGRIQLYLRADSFAGKDLILLGQIDIGDILGVSGDIFKTHTGEITVKVGQLVLLSKSLRPLPEKWHGLKDVEIRYRQRYLDLLSNEEVRDVFVTRAKVIRSVRAFLDNRGFLEVETPMMHSIPGGAAGRPFKTHHNEYDMPLYLRIAPELYLKRLLVGGFEKVYEINRSFRNEGVSTRHNPEFTMLEVYAAYEDYSSMMRLCEEMVCGLVKELHGGTKFTFQGKEIDVAAPWKRVSFAETVKDKFGILPSDSPEEMLSKLHAEGVAKGATRLSRSQITKIIEDLLEEGMTQNPTFVTDYFTSMCPLARTTADNPLLSERFELFISGMETGNAYSELNDPQEQEARFREETAEAVSEDEKSVDEDYVTALGHGMPPAGGLGIGIDRLVMLLTDKPSIRDVILFPLLRLEKAAGEARE